MRRVPAVASRQRKRRVPAPRPSDDQLAWIRARDRVGRALDAYLKTAPAPVMRAAIADVEASLANGDHAVGLLK